MKREASFAKRDTLREIRFTEGRVAHRFSGGGRYCVLCGGMDAVIVTSPRHESASPLHRRWAKAVIGVALGGLMGILSAGALAGVRGRLADLPRCSVRVAAPRVVVLKSKRVLHLFDGETLVRTYPIDLGRNPVGPKRHEGDGRTPTGRFHVVTKNCNSPYHRFIGIDYPNGSAVDWGLAHGLISPGEAASIRETLSAARCPDWGTALGGGIGLHGHRKGRDWTAGCVALSDEHVEELFAVLRVGDPVEILP